jgi:integrase
MRSADFLVRHRSQRASYRCLVLLMYRHGLRVSEAIALRWSQVDLKEGQIHVRRLKNGKPSVQRSSAIFPIRPIYVKIGFSASVQDSDGTIAY